MWKNYANEFQVKWMIRIFDCGSIPDGNSHGITLSLPDRKLPGLNDDKYFLSNYTIHLCGFISIKKASRFPERLLINFNFYICLPDMRAFLWFDIHFISFFYIECQVKRIKVGRRSVHTECFRRMRVRINACT